MIAEPSFIASTAIPRTLLLRTFTSLASLFKTASIYSSVSGVFAGIISLPVLSQTASVVFLPSISRIIDFLSVLRTCSSGAPRVITSVDMELRPS